MPSMLRDMSHAASARKPRGGARDSPNDQIKDANCTDGANFGKVDMGFRQTGSKAPKMVRTSWSRSASDRPTAVCVSVPVRHEWVSPLLVPIFAA